MVTLKSFWLMPLFLLVLFCGNALSEEKVKERYFGLGLEIFNLSLKIDGKSVPAAVKQEAADPTIYHHRSGNTFTKDQIGTYDPGEEFDSEEFRLYLRITPFKWRLQPFVELGCVFFNESDDDKISTNDGFYNRGYTYFNLLGHSGVDYIGYWYGIRYDVNPFSPAVGLAYRVNNDFRMIARVQMQEVELTYQKGIEAYGRPEGHITLAKEIYKVYTACWLFEFGDEIVGGSIGPTYTFGSDGIEGELGLIVSIVYRF